VPLAGRVRAMHAVAIKLAGLEAGNVAVPDLVRIFGKRNARRLVSICVEQAEVDLGRIRGIEGEVDTACVRGSTERDRGSRLDANAGAAHWPPPFAPS
jgi:hypothetical protein